jgi:hypothetical protein
MNPLPHTADKPPWDAGGGSMALGVTELTLVLGISAIAALIIYWTVGRASS